MKRAVFLSLLIILCLVAACGCAGGSAERGAQLLETDRTAATNGGGRAGESRSVRTEVGEAISFEQEAGQKAAARGGADTKKSAGGGVAVEGTAGQGSVLIGKDAALKIALKHAGVADSKVSWREVELDHEKGRQIYEVEFLAGEKKYEYDIDARTGKVISYEYKVKQAAPAKKVESLIGEKAAREIALKHAGVADSKVSWREVELDYEKGRQIYELEFYAGEKEYEYEIDAGTGAILSCEVESRKAPR